MTQKIETGEGTVRKESGSDFWQGKTPCWEMCHCTGVIRSECPAYKYPSLPCWEIEGTYCKLTADGTRGNDTSICKRCRVYRRWGENKPIELKLSGKGIDSFRRFLREKADAALDQEPVPLPSEAFGPGSEEKVYADISGRRYEVYFTKLDEIIDKQNAEGVSLTKTLKEIQDEYDWLPMDALEHGSERLKIPATKVYRTAIMGKGLSVIPREGHRVEVGVCIVDLLKHYLDFLRHDLCGKCVPCREGMQQMYNIVTDIAEGKGDETSVGTLEEIAGWVAELAACNQGTIAANIVLTALGDHSDQIRDHLHGRECPAGVCDPCAREN